MEGEAPAIRALGSLFKLTEVYIWEDGSTETREISLFPEPSKSSQDYDNVTSNIPALTSDFSPIGEDVELTKELDALGLPVAFQSNKETRNKMKRSKKKDSHLKHSCGHTEAFNEAQAYAKVSGVEIVSPAVLHDNTSNSLCSMSMMGQSESYFCDVAVGISEFKCPTGEDSASSTKIISGCAVMEQMFDGISDGLSNNSQESELLPHSDVMLKDGNKKGWNLSNPDSATPPSSCLTDAGIDHGEKELGGSLMEDDCLEDCSTAYHQEKDEEFHSDNGTGHAGIPETVVFSQGSEVLGHDGVDSHDYNSESGDWTVYWDSLYMRNYFHNVKTRTSTWYPPPGMEHLEFDDITTKSNEVITEVTEMDGGPSICCGLLNYSESLEETPSNNRLASQLSDEFSVVPVNGAAADNSRPGISIPTVNDSFNHPDELHGINKSCDDEIALCLQSDAREHIGCLTSTIAVEDTEDGSMYIEIADPTTDKLDTQVDPAMKKQKKKARKKRMHRKSSKDGEELQCQEIFKDFPGNLAKYWCQRYLLFSRFDDGIKMDEEGWFSVTPEPIARHHALRCVSDVIIDCFTGVGGNAIQFAQKCKHVIAIDIDAKKIDYAYHNASIYGVDDRIDFIKGDFFVLAPKLKADTVFLSPPWGGPNYSKVQTYDIKTMLKPHDGYFLFNTAKQIACKIIMFLPRNIDLNQLAELCLSVDPPWSLEVEKNFLNGKLKAITAYFNDTVVEGK